MQDQSLATKLGIAAHLSLLRRVARSHGLVTEGELLEEAVARGCFHFLRSEKPPASRVSPSSFSHEQLSIAMLSVANPWDQWLLRAGAMLLSHPTNNPALLAYYARWERCESVVRSIAAAGQLYEPTNFFWAQLLQHLPTGVPLAEGVLPHHSRYVSIPGKIGPGKLGKPVWLRPHLTPALGYAA
jgi:hypothetical protein